MPCPLPDAGERRGEGEGWLCRSYRRCLWSELMEVQSPCWAYHRLSEGSHCLWLLWLLIKRQGAPPSLTLFGGLIQLFVLGTSHLLGSVSLKVSVWCLAVSGSLHQICPWPLVCVTPANCDRKNGDLIAERERKVLEEEWGIRGPTEHHYYGFDAGLPCLPFLLLPHPFQWILSACWHCFHLFIYCFSVEHWIS